MVGIEPTNIPQTIHPKNQQQQTTVPNNPQTTIPKNSDNKQLKLINSGKHFLEERMQWRKFVRFQDQIELKESEIQKFNHHQQRLN
jgi:hypothetical protein